MPRLATVLASAAAAAALAAAAAADTAPFRAACAVGADAEGEAGLVLTQTGDRRFVGAPAGKREPAGVRTEPFILSLHPGSDALARARDGRLEPAERQFEGTATRMAQTVQFESAAAPGLFFLFNLHSLEGVAILPGAPETRLLCEILP